MNAAIFDYTPFANLRKGLRGWWLTPLLAATKKYGCAVS